MGKCSVFHISKIIFLLLSLFLLLTVCQKSIEDSCPCTNFPLYEEATNNADYKWFPSGWMGDISSITCNEQWKINPHLGLTCIKISYNAVNDTLWSGIYWLNGNQWKGPGINVNETYRIPYTHKLKVSFWSRGELGGETVQFKVGGVLDAGDSFYPPVESSWIKLSNIWSRYEIDISGKDLSNLVGGFCWVVDNAHNPTLRNITLYLDDIIYETSN